PKTENYSRTEWRKNGIPIRASQTTLLDTSRHATLRIPAFSLADSGVYDCVITNDRLAGIVLTSAQVQVLGRLALVAPVAVRLHEPLMNEEDVPLRPRFAWSAVQGADTYRCEIGADASFAQIISSVSISQSASILASGSVVATPETAPELFARAFPLQNDRRYAWRVRAENSVGTSAWAVGGFTTVPSDAVLTIGTYDFGRLARFDSAQGVITLRNFGSSPLTLESVSADNAAFVLEEVRQGTVLLAGGEMHLGVSTKSQAVGNARAGITVRFRVGLSSTVQTRPMANRIMARVQAVKLLTPALDTAVVGRRLLNSLRLVNLSDEVLTVRSVALQNMVQAYSLRSVSKNLELQAQETTTLLLETKPAQAGRIAEEMLRIETVRGDEAIVGRENYDTVQTTISKFAREVRREDVFVKAGIKTLTDSIAPGGLVTLELSLTPLNNASYLDITRHSNTTFAGTLRWNPQVLTLDASEKTIRRIRTTAAQTIATSANSQAAVLESFSIPTSNYDWRLGKLLLHVKLRSVAGNTDVTPLVLENLEWGTGTVFIDTLESGSFTSKPCVAGGKRLVTSAKATQLAVIAPNPAKDEVSIAYTLREDSAVEIALVDMHGKTAQLLVSEEQAAGEYTITKALKNVPSGAYTVRLSTQNGVVTKRVSVVRSRKP
ncbi:MAG: T9SS C-terminal target domain-containing protein, partial [Candidatus Kapaibacterium sp.]